MYLNAKYVEIEGGPHVMCVTHAAEVPLMVSVTGPVRGSMPLPIL